MQRQLFKYTVQDLINFSLAVAVKPSWIIYKALIVIACTNSWMPPWRTAMQRVVYIYSEGLDFTKGVW